MLVIFVHRFRRSYVRVRVRVRVLVLSVLFDELFKEETELISGFVFEGLNLFYRFCFLFDLKDKVGEFEFGLVFLALYLLEELSEALNVLQRLFDLFDFCFFFLAFRSL